MDSPELISAQDEFLVTLERKHNSRLDRFLLNESGHIYYYSAHDKLRYWDVPESEIETIRNRGEIMQAITFVSPFDGWVIQKHAFQGMYMKPGTRFYRIADMRTMWIYVTIYEYQLPLVELRGR